MNEHQPQPNNPAWPTRAATACTQPKPCAAGGGYQPVDTHNALNGRDLRYVLTDYISQGYSTIAKLVKKLAEDGYTVWGRASKVVSDALRWEIRNRRVRRIRRGVYAIASIPRTTRYRIQARTQALFLAPHVVAIRRTHSDIGDPNPHPPADRLWRKWRQQVSGES